MTRLDKLLAGALLVAGASLGACLFLFAPHGKGPEIQDEFAYLLQAKMLASGHLSYPSPPLAEFFEAAHVLVVPRYAAKYLPGHAAVLAPFVAFGVPWLAPALLLGATFALLYAAARYARLPIWAALLAVAVFAGSTEAILAFSGYLSQSSSIALVTAAIAAAAALRNRASLPRCALLFSCASAAAFVRPFTGVAAIAAAIVVLATLRPRPLATYAIAAAVPLLAAGTLGLAVCRATTGSWTLPPWKLYAQQYMPFDGPGIGAVGDSRPSRALPAHLAPLARSFEQSREAYAWQRIPSEASRRLEIVEDLPPGRVSLAFVAAGALSPALLFAWVFAPLYFALQLTFHVGMPTYYVE
ncbi:MAG TPA: hypothetical protein VG496_16955, partial [Myxococcales bacterium]|nr:hypothetical protein [Myxococcales bacterium]